jgi:hypothetical protein
VRALRRFSPMTVVRLPDGAEIGIPSWMLDPLACSQVKDEPRPRVAVSALLELRQLLDGQSLLSADPAVTCCADHSAGGNDAQQQTCSRSPAKVLVREGEPVGEAPPRNTTSLRTAIGPDTLQGPSA